MVLGRKFLTLQSINNLLIDKLNQNISGIKPVDESLIKKTIRLINKLSNKQCLFLLTDLTVYY